MYFRILKKDLKRKKTMNCILLMFVILSAMFAASSVNNIVAVMGGVDYYFDKAEMADYFIQANEPNDSDELSKELEKVSCVNGIKRERNIMVTSDQLLRSEKMLTDYSVGLAIMPIDEAKINYFDRDNNVLSEVEQGKVYLSGELIKYAALEPGDRFDIKIGETKISAELAGIHKDAYFDSLGSSRLLLNKADYDKLAKDSEAKPFMSSIYHINTNDFDAMDKAIGEIDGSLFHTNIEMIKTSFFMDMLVAGMMLILGICLILVSFVVLRFTIGFTVAEEFREIGVMKAVGIRNNSIRMLYLVKYLGISVIGAVIGYFASIPFGRLLIASVSEHMVLGSDNSVIIGILCCIAVVGIIVLFCFGCTKQIKKLSPIDAVRSGQTGERFNKKSVMHLGKSRLGTAGFLSLNDVLSGVKQYGIITAVFTLCLLLVVILANTANTINSEQMLYLFGTTKSDVYYLGDTASIVDVMNGEKTYKQIVADMQDKLEENDIHAKVFVEEIYQLPMSFGDKNMNLTFQICKDTKAEDYVYCEGTAPKYENEIALGTAIADRLGAKVGDKVSITIDGKKSDYFISALFRSMYNLGEIGRFHESVDIPNDLSFGAAAYQIDFDDDPDLEVLHSRIDKMKDIFGSKQVFDLQDFLSNSTGVSDIIDSVKYLVLAIAIIIVIMISVLMERSFISKEKAEIALMKAIGFRSSSIIAQHTLRFVIVSVISSLIAMLICVPMTKFAIDPVFAMLGAAGGISYKIEPVEVFAVYPAVILAATIAGTFFTSLYTKTIKASDTSDIE